MLAAKVIESRISLQINELRCEHSALNIKAIWWSQFCTSQEFSPLITSQQWGVPFIGQSSPILHFLLLEKDIKSSSFFLEVVNSV